MIMNHLAQKTEQYLQTILPGLAGVLRPAPKAMLGRLPHYLTRYTLFVLPIAMREVLLAIAPEGGTVGDVKKVLGNLAKLTGLPVLYVTEAVKPYERQRLIKAGLEFVVPGSQLFAPTLGLALREQYARTRRATTDQLSPSAQAMLIRFLLGRTGPVEPATAVAGTIGYTAMTATRAVRELSEFNLMRSHKKGRTTLIELADGPAEIWVRAKPFMRNPVLRLEYPRHRMVQCGRELMRLAGLDALSCLTMLAEPRRHVWAVYQNDWPTIQQEIVPGDGFDDERESVQVWAYPPTLGCDKATVDPLSLIMTLADNHDDRVRMAVDELETKLWLASEG